jgi:hypothetical protein
MKQGLYLHEIYTELVDVRNFVVVVVNCAYHVNPNPHCLGIIQAFFCKNKNKSWMVVSKYLKKNQKCLPKNLKQTFLFQRF